YFDPDPCRPPVMYRPNAAAIERRGAGSRGSDNEDRSLGVTVEARFSVGEYDIVILSARESNGL
ncbi:MAG TPA: DUF2330 domain-containing protein, partial [Cyanobacteria bacterium UBA8543]|nr:DUF2330 domain-containing protein [Cyanobacteria bacterium UBA8543]